VWPECGAPAGAPVVLPPYSLVLVRLSTGVGG